MTVVSRTTLDWLMGSSRRVAAVEDFRVLGILVGRLSGISDPGIGPGRPAPEVTVPAPVDRPEGVTPLVSDVAPDIPEPEPTEPIVEGGLSFICAAAESRKLDVLAL